MTGKIIIYDHMNFGGESREITGNVPRLGDLGFDNRIASVKVMNSLWVGYEHNDYTGKQYILEEGDHPAVERWIMDKLSSLKRLNLESAGETPRITLYEHANYRGKTVTSTYGILGLNWFGFDNVISALKVQTGVWVLYENFDYKGVMYVVTEGDYPHPTNWRGANDNISSLRPAKYPYVPTEVLRMDFALDAALVNNTPIALVNMLQRNDTSKDQTASWSTTRTLSTTKSSEWHWDNETAVSVKTTFTTGVPLIAQAGVTMSVANTFSIGQGQGEKNTQTDSWNAKLPATAKSRKALRVKIMIQFGKVDVPFTATLKRGNKQWQEKGTYKGTNCYNLNVDYAESPL